MINIVNLTGSEVVVLLAGATVALPANGPPARVIQQETPAPPVHGIPTYRVADDRVVNLPGPKGDQWYLVTAVVAEAAQRDNRMLDDLLVPGEPVLDADGRSLGCMALRRVR